MEKKMSLAAVGEKESWPDGASYISSLRSHALVAEGFIQ